MTLEEIKNIIHLKSPLKSDFILGGSSKRLSSFLDLFTPGDFDAIYITDSDHFDYYHTKIKNICIFIYKKDRTASPDLILEYMCRLSQRRKISIAGLLDEEFCNKIGININNVLEKQDIITNCLESLVLKNKKYTYIKKYWEYMLQNRSFLLTNELLLDVFNIYKLSRK